MTELIQISLTENYGIIHKEKWDKTKSKLLWHADKNPLSTALASYQTSMRTTKNNSNARSIKRIMKGKLTN